MAGTSAPSTNNLEIDMFCCKLLRATATRFMRIFLELTIMDPFVQRAEHRTQRLPPALKTLTNLIGIVFFMLTRNIFWSASLGRTQILKLSANIYKNKSVQMMTADVNVTRASACFNTLVGLPAPPVIDGGRTHRVPSNMAGTSAPSTNNLEIDMFCCRVHGPLRPVSCERYAHNQ